MRVLKRKLQKEGFFKIIKMKSNYQNQKDVFLHVSALEKSKFRILKENQIIQFEIKEERGKLQAINLKRPKK